MMLIDYLSNLWLLIVLGSAGMPMLCVFAEHLNEEEDNVKPEPSTSSGLDREKSISLLITYYKRSLRLPPPPFLRLLMKTMTAEKTKSRRSMMTSRTRQDDSM